VLLLLECLSFIKLDIFETSHVVINVAKLYRAVSFLGCAKSFFLCEITNKIGDLLERNDAFGQL